MVIAASNPAVAFRTGGRPEVFEYWSFPGLVTGRLQYLKVQKM